MNNFFSEKVLEEIKKLESEPTKKEKILSKNECVELVEYLRNLKNKSIGKSKSVDREESTKIFFNFDQSDSLKKLKSKIEEQIGEFFVNDFQPHMITCRFPLRLHIDTGKNPDGFTINGMQITAGSDYAERFPIAYDSLSEPGMVMVLDLMSLTPGQLTVSTKPYDRTVVGVISGANGLSPAAVIGEGDQPIAMSGRVWTYCDTSNGNIKPGDLLTTSSTPGYAMKVTNISRWQGAIIGKALSSLQLEKGFVLMLVMLK